MRSGKLLFACLSLLLALSALLPAAATTPQREGVSPNSPTLVTRLAADDNGVSFTFNSPAFSVDDNGIVSAPGLAIEGQIPGAPALPGYSRLLALPPGAEVSVDVSAVDVTTTAVPPIRPVPNTIPLRPADPSASPLAGDLETVFQPDSAIYNQDALYPAAPFTVSEPFYAGDARLVRLTLYPYRYNPAAGEIVRAGQLRVTAVFHGRQTAPVNQIAGPAATVDGRLLNPEQAAGWRGLPQSFDPSSTVLPIGVDTYKIEVDADGIYELTRTDLQAAGMNVGVVNPRTFEMVYRGQPIAYQLVNDDGDNTFDSNERVRFYGWAFDGDRLEKQYVTNNIYWLWAGGTAATVGTAVNDTGAPVATSFRQTIIEDPEYTWWPTWTNQWPSLDNEPDAWYWDYLHVGNGSIRNDTFTVTLPYPAAAGSDAVYSVEVLSRGDQGVVDTHVMHTLYAANPLYGRSVTWTGLDSFNITATVPMAELSTGANVVSVTLASPTPSGGANVDRVFVNGVTWDYWRQTEAVADALILGDDAGPRTFAVSGFSSGSVADAIVWNITDRTNPVRLTLSPGDISGGSGVYTYTFGSSAAAGQQFAATTAAAANSPLAISQYTPPDLDPAAGADWVAIAHANFVGGIGTLTAHRQNPAYGGLSTHVVDVADVINQYGYGLPVPQAIKSYLAHALADWPTAPGYLLLVGDSTHNPRQITCQFGCGGNPMTGDQQFVMTDLQFADRYQGLIPVDTTFSLLVGDDYYPDLAVGRLPVQTAAELSDIINKIIRFEQNQLTPAAWMENALFVSDEDDPLAGYFCAENMDTSAILPDHFDITHLCLPNGADDDDVDALRAQMMNVINNDGVTFFNYRGHGSIESWANAILSTTPNHVDAFLNINRYPVLLSADCLDGYFAWPDAPGLGETFLGAGQRGTAGHWSSVGLGLSVEHTQLHEGFYIGLFDQGYTAVGDTINYAKSRYVTNGLGDLSEVLAFTYLGDPAMQLMRQDLAVTKTASQSSVAPGEVVNFTIELQNGGIYPPKAIATDNLPADLEYISASGSPPVAVTVSGSEVVMQLQEPLAWNGTATINLQARVADDAPAGQRINTVTVDGFGLEMTAGDETDTAAFTVAGEPQNQLFLPMVRRP